MKANLIPGVSQTGLLLFMTADMDSWLYMAQITCLKKAKFAFKDGVTVCVGGRRKAGLGRRVVHLLLLLQVVTLRSSIRLR